MRTIDISELEIYDMTGEKKNKILVEEGVAALVSELLFKHNIKTCGSCEGHEINGEKTLPWIQIMDSDEICRAMKVVAEFTNEPVVIIDPRYLPTEFCVGWIDSKFRDNLDNYSNEQFNIINII